MFYNYYGYCSVVSDVSIRKIFTTISLNDLLYRTIVIFFPFRLTTIMMFVTNHQTSSGFDKAAVVIKSSLSDAEMFIHDINHQMTFTITEGLNSLIDRVKIDLESNLISYFCMYLFLCY